MTDARATLRELRRTRTKRRLGSTDWIDIAYRVYLFAFAGLIAVVVVSDAIDGLIDDDVDVNVLLTKGPSILGIAVMLAVALGLRSGADGGPISVETADIRHVLLAPMSRRAVLFTPIWQRLRSTMFSFGLVGAVVGQLVATELVGSRAAWAASCAIFGAIVGALFVGAGVLAHAAHLARWAASLVGTLLVAWQAAVAWGIWNDETEGIARIGPANLAGNVALWGIDQRPIDWLAIVIAAVVVGLSLVCGDRLRLEPLARRGELVSQLRFAATSQDLRTVVLLRRQLRAEAPRNRAWFGTRVGSASQAGERPAPTVGSGHSPPVGPRRRDGGTTSPAHQPKRSVVWRRGLRSFGRLPASRVVRIVILAIAAGVFGSLTVTASPLFALLLLGAIFVLGLESIEALSQEVDRADRTDGLPIDRGWIFANHLLAPAVLLAVTGMISATTASILDPQHIVAAFAIAVPVLWGGALGPVVATVNDAPPTASAATTTLMGTERDTEMSFMPQEFAGATTVISTLLPVAISCIGVVPVVLLRLDPTAATGLRAVIGVGLAIALTATWVRRRDVWSTKIRTFFAEGKAAQKK
ncbi:MAG: hypothetical protein ABWZ99_16620 [Ilumatobacteraceae bacterium]